MAILISVAVGIFTIYLSKLYLGKWYNHLAVYAFIWMWMILLYELKLLPYYPIIDYTWFIIAGGFLSFFLGTITVFANNEEFYKNFKPALAERQEIPLVSDGGQLLKYAIVVSGLLGLFGALYDWKVLIDKFGSIGQVFISANTIYRLRVESQLEGMIPYIHAFSSIGIVLSGFYIGYKNRFKLIVLLPLAASILKSVADFGRVRMLFGIVLFVSSVLLARHLFSKISERRKNRIRGTIIVVVGFAFILTTAAVVKTFRTTYESFKGQSHTLAQFRDNPFFSPSIYLYLSSHIGVLNVYLQKDKEMTRLGENTFAPFYNLLAKFELAERVPYDMQGYNIPMWTNTGTILRDLHADFGAAGVFLVPYLMGVFLSVWWRKFYTSGRLIYFVLLSNFYLVVTISFFSSATRGADWFAALFILLAGAPILENLADWNRRRKLEN